MSRATGGSGWIRGSHVYWVDWLKVLAVLGVFFYHSTMIFVLAPWMLTNDEHSAALTLVAGTGFFFGMPLLFLLSGAASVFALRSRSLATFLRLRFARLVLPLVAGLALLSPLQAYFVQASKGSHQPIWQYFPTFFDSIQLFWNPRWFGTYGYHLWFLAFLFLYSVLAVPIFAWLRHPSGRGFLQKLADVGERPAGLLVFVIPLLLAQISLRARFPWYQDWTDFAYLFVFFVCGYLLLAEPRFPSIIRRRAPITLSLSLGAGALALLLFTPGWFVQWEKYPGYAPGFVGYELIRTMLVWSVVVCVLAIGIRFLDFRNRFLDYASEGVMPFYVLHHPVIVGIGFYVISWRASLWLKFGVITVTSLAATVLIYELAIRRFQVMRWLFGMRPLPTPPVRAVVQVPSIQPDQRVHAQGGG